MNEYRVDPKKLFQKIAKMNDQQRSAFILQETINMMNQKKIEWATRIRGKKETGGYTEAFQKFWDEYPKNRRTGKGAAMTVWSKMGDEEELLDLCLAALAWQKRSKSWKEGYIPLPETYLRQRRFDDDAPEETSTGYTDMNGVWHEG